MDWTNFLSTLVVTLIHVYAIVNLIVRYRKIKDIALLGLAFSFAFVTVAYVAFTYNAVMGLSNAPWRYWLRFGNGAVAFAFIMVSVSRSRDERHMVKAFKDLGVEK